MTTEKSAIKNLFNNLKSTMDEPVSTPTQAVAPVKSTMQKGETPFTLHFPTQRLKMLKLKSAEEDISIKELINNAIYKQYGI